MELKPKSDIVWQVSCNEGKATFSMGFAEGFVCCGNQIRLMEPFTKMPIRSGPGLVLCRGPWTHGTVFTLGPYIVHPYPYQYWMALDASDLIRVHDYLDDLNITAAPKGYQRPFDL